MARLKTKTQAAMITALNQVKYYVDQTNNVTDWDIVMDHVEAALNLIADDQSNPVGAKFAGSDYNPARDDNRLTKQIGRVYQALSDGEYHTLPDIVEMTGDPHASISAQIRHLRKPHHGNWIVEVTKPANSNLYLYKLFNPDGTPRNV